MQKHERSRLNLNDAHEFTRTRKGVQCTMLRPFLFEILSKEDNREQRVLSCR